MTIVRSYAAHNNIDLLQYYEYEMGGIDIDEIEVAVEYCGICHSDISMIQNDWRITTYPLVPGHEIVGKVVAIGDGVKHLEIGDRIGIGWITRSCMHCDFCIAGMYNLCPGLEQCIVGRHGGFADRVRCHWAWAVPLPEDIDLPCAGPLFCAGLTVFNAMIQNNVKPTDKVALVGLGGLGHLAVQFMNKWGCEVTVFTSSADKTDDAISFGARYVVDSKDINALKEMAGYFNFVLSTVNVPLDWAAFYSALSPVGILHIAGVVLGSLSIPGTDIIVGQKLLTGGPLGSPSAARKMVDFCVRHSIFPQVKKYKMSEVNEAIKYMKEGKARYRIVLENDFA